MKDILFVTWLGFFFLSAGVYAYMIHYVRKNHSSLYETWGRPSLFTASLRQIKMIQPFIYIRARQNDIGDSYLTKICTLLKFVETMYIILFVFVAIDIMK